ncbi:MULTISPECIES: UdgX family uracil-DNA binding protein [Gordonia]|uniref:Type-4 uracil-DNA glycosylase n=1 Tax=Gordonia amicalis TaxID=89053 RepID=A0AAE4R313_9ACTN|nr:MULTISPECIES: UdgX family uracil-DNA binding protein [Gordonia]ATD71045.1 uracil-DNA glycosylase [Gordonia sp. 1D]KAF0969799.1 Type-4 uracil-DNA glycosylase [Gordonia sp. YY1]MCZ4653394.1 UdgX family uracil-DNA binding protein [Gordonia amicalis]MDJ0453143.1 UdgX family uracil-DNA binding protein [Gordonia amicalis]MDV6312425.1 UdgX family uracil-DNA binding protein [Gordonia amicalis]
MAFPGAERFLPDSHDLDDLVEAARTCRGCDLYKAADQTVFGAGSPGSTIMFVGEQPGDQEDRAGKPFVGPAGRVFDRALDAAEIDRELTYVTNAVKHFKFTRAAGQKRRIHDKPSRTEVVACRPWLLAELDAVAPRIVVCLGATAAQALLGSTFRLTRHRGERFDLAADGDVGPDYAVDVLATVHPSSILRGPSDKRDRAFDEFVADLRVVRELLQP